MDNLLDEIDGCNDKIEKIGSLGDIGSLDKIDKLSDEYLEIEKNRGIISKFIKDIKHNEIVIQNKKREIKKVQDEIKEGMEELDICENCGQVLTEEAVDYMMEKV